MQSKLVGIVVLVALAIVLVYSVSAPAAPNATNAAAIPAAARQPNSTTASAAEPHPEIREAIAALRRAKQHMEHAAHDFGGHRVEAIKATDVAIRQLEECLRYDKD